MPRNAIIYRVLIASPSDVSEERRLLKDIIFNWNASHSVDMGILFEPVLWESHVYPNLGHMPQEIVNTQIVQNADILIGVFWTRVGTKTEKFNSGTIEEIHQIVEAKKPALVYFSNKQTQPDLIDFEQYKLVKDFKEYCSEAGIINTYSDQNEFKLKVIQNLSQLAFRLSNTYGNNYEVSSPITKKKKKSASAYSYKMDRERLRIQADFLIDIDRKAIERAINHVGVTKIIKVLDVGCVDGYVTSSRFLNYEHISVIGIDISEEAVKSANDEFSSKSLEFKVHDIEASESNIGKFDIIFCAFTMHHLKNPEGTLHRLWSMLNSKGALVIRGSDDGLKINYPDNEDLDFLLKSTNNMPSSSDRQYGRKIYSHMMGLIPEPVEITMDFDVRSTVGMTAKERIDYFDYIFSYRSNYAKQLTKKPLATKYDFDLSKKLTNIIDGQREYFKNESRLFSVTVQNIALAYKP